ncbi:MAG: S23 ribosomal [Prolixibacteraceae bacterium]|nr:MAG: S23 ribosomal [Prolixibacteraceae bacterium]
MKLEDMEIYNISMEIGDEIWFSVVEWENLAKYSIGQQIVRSADSIAANISEGYGRYHFKDRKNFMFYARGSHYETITWLTKAQNRKIISNEFFEGIIAKMEKLGVKMNNYINTLESKTNNKSQ